MTAGREREGGGGAKGERHHVMVVTIIRMMRWETRTEVHHIRSSTHVGRQTQNLFPAFLATDSEPLNLIHILSVFIYTLQQLT